MSYDAAKNYDAGEELLKGEVAKAEERLERYRWQDSSTRTRDVDSYFLPGRRARDGEQEELDQNQPEIIGRLPDPGEQFHYSLEPDPDGDGWIVCLVSGPDPDADQEQNNGEWSTAGDRVMKHHLHGKDRLLRQMNRDARRHWSRDTGATRDKQNTMFRHGPLLAGERLKLVGPDKYGLWSVVLISADDPDIAPRENVGRAGASRSVTGGDKGYARGSSAEALHRQNSANRDFWKDRRI
jgi:hypothetical protein